MAEWKKKRQHMKHYNQTAHLYNRRYAEEQTLKIKAAVSKLKLPRQKAVLDLGCGTGVLLQEVHEIADIIIGLDISKKMLKEVPLQIKHSANVHLILADADHIPMLDSWFDTVFAITLLQNIPNPVNTLQEVKRIAQPDASIGITGLKKHFTESSFLTLMKRVKMNVEWLNTDIALKCYVAICTFQ